MCLPIVYIVYKHTNRKKIQIEEKRPFKKWNQAVMIHLHERVIIGYVIDNAIRCIHTLRIPFASQYWSSVLSSTQRTNTIKCPMNACLSITICNSVFFILIQWQSITLFHLFFLFFQLKTGLSLKWWTWELPLFILLHLNQRMYFFLLFWLHKTNYLTQTAVINQVENDVKSMNLWLKMYHICTLTIKKMWIQTR